MKRQINADELELFYHNIGSAVWHIQYLEETLVQYVVMIESKRDPTTETNAYDRLAIARRNVLGRIYKRAKSVGIIPKTLEARFEKFLEERNWLIHRSMHECGSHLYDDVLRVRMLDRISMIQEEALAINRILYNELLEFMVAEGYDLEEAFQIAHGRLLKLVET